MSGRVLVACVGNVLRGDDGFGTAVAEALAAGDLPAHAELIETGIGGMEIVHRLMDGYGALVIVDAIDRQAAPGTLYVFEPTVEEPQALGTDRWREMFSNLHLAEPSRVLLMARAIGVLPERVFVVACQTGEHGELEMALSPPVQAAVPLAAERVREVVGQLLERENVAG